jgi:hypothetical protein
MSSPEQHQNQTTLTSPPVKQARMVRIKAIHPIRTMKGDVEVITTPGNTVEVTEDEAKEFCDRPFDIGYKQAFGNIDPSMARKTVIHRAERVK